MSGGPFGLMHIAKTKDFGSWTYVGTVFNEETKPAWAAPGSFFWAPDIRYVDGQYVMYFTVTNTQQHADPWDFAIGAATAPTPAGPWTATDGPVVEPRPSGDGRLLQHHRPGAADHAGRQAVPVLRRLLRRIWVTELTPDGLHAVGEPTQVAIGDRYEGAYVVRKDGWYYLMASSSNCCAGPTTGYTVFAGRSKSPRGPFLDADGAEHERLPGRRHPGTAAEREPLDRHRPPRADDRRGRAGPHRLPRDRPERALAERRVRR